MSTASPSRSTRETGTSLPGALAQVEVRHRRSNQRPSAASRSAGAVTPSIVYWKKRNVSETATAAVATSSRPRRSTNAAHARR